MKRRASKKVRLLVIILLIVILVGAGVAWGFCYWRNYEANKFNPNVPMIYQDDYFGLKFNYPEQTTVQTLSAGGGTYFRDGKVFKLPIVSGTNLTTKSLQLTILGATCENQKKTSKEKAVYNGLEFYKTYKQEGAAGSNYEDFVYSIDKNGNCFVFDFLLRSSNVLRGQGVPAFDKEKESEIFAEILKTIKFLK